MKNPKISVVVPVYNAELYLKSCIDSLLSQSFNDFEVLLIDDGSSDLSGDICDQYAAKDSRVRAFHTENRGVSSARNLGLDHVCGEWVVFVDADDEITDGFLDINKQFENADIIQKSYVIINENKEENKYSNDVSILREKEAIFRYYVQKRNNALWDKLIKNELIGKQRFNTKVSIGEDFLFFLSLLPKVKVWAFDDAGHYRYFVRNGSAMHSLEQKKRIEILYENIRHIQELSQLTDLQVLQNCVIFKSYVTLLCKYRKELNARQVEVLKELFFKMRVRNLKYVDLKTKLKLLLYKVKFLMDGHKNDID